MIDDDKYEVWTNAGRGTALHRCGGSYVIATYDDSGWVDAHKLRQLLEGNGWTARVREIQRGRA